ncbi:MAG: conserved membrane protein of unknown function [Promethearchaeota archaeon]|nr:MAG: conserved membrane protein of unknown function [Candidatus Lokiarchaeota archaeon]
MELKNYQKLRIIAGILLIASAITHLGQLIVVGFEWHDLAAAIIGGLYGVLGILLLLYKENRPLTFIGIIYPFIGGTLGLVRLISIEIAQNGTINWFIVWHLIVDIIVVPSLFLYYISFTGMNGQNQLSFLTIVMFFITALIHILQIYYGINLENIGTTIFGFIYIGIAVLVWTKEESKRVHILAIDIPIIGGIIGLILFFFTYNPFLIFFLIVDILIVYLRIHIYKTYYMKK